MIVTEEQIRDEVLDAIKQHHVMLFMKGVPEAPRCGFSMQVVQILRRRSAPSIAAMDILPDPRIRQVLSAGVRLADDPAAVRERRAGRRLRHRHRAVRGRQAQGAGCRLARPVVGAGVLGLSTAQALRRATGSGSPSTSSMPWAPRSGRRPGRRGSSAPATRSRLRAARPAWPSRSGSGWTTRACCSAPGCSRSATRRRGNARGAGAPAASRSSGSSRRRHSPVPRGAVPGAGTVHRRCRVGARRPRAAAAAPRPRRPGGRPRRRSACAGGGRGLRLRRRLARSAVRAPATCPAGAGRLRRGAGADGRR